MANKPNPSKSDAESSSASAPAAEPAHRHHSTGPAANKPLAEMNLIALSHSLSIAMHNLVAQQQQAMVLLNAITSRAAQAILEGHVEVAERLVKLSRDLLRPQSFIDSMRELAVLSIQISQQEPPNNLAELEQWWTELSRKLSASQAAPEPAPTSHTPE